MRLRKRHRRFGIDILEPRVLLASAPIIIMATDAVTPGTAFTVNGTGMTPASVHVAIALEPANGVSPSTPPANAIYPTITQTDTNSADGEFVTATMPSTATPGVYDLWVENANGWSSPYLLNAARSLYTSQYQAYNGMTMEVVGRNFNQTEFGGKTETEVRLNDGAGHLISESIGSLTPYDISFAVTGATVGTTYYVEVSNDNGADWSRPISGQTLTIISAPSDPLGLGVPWAGVFNWNNVYNVNSYGASGTTTTDVTTDVQNAVNAASSGGGVVYFPNGTYYISHIALPADVVLEGQSEYGAQIYYDGSGGSSFIRSNGSGNASFNASDQGVARLSIFLANTTNVADRPDLFINLGSGVNTTNLSDNLFVSNVNINYPTSTGDSNGADGHRGIAFGFAGDQNPLLQNSTFVGWEGGFGGYENQYSIIRNNYFEYSCEEPLDSASYSFWENNQVVIHSEYDQDCHGFFGRSYGYYANNVIENAGDTSNAMNDGEALCTEEPGSQFSDFGAVTSATSTSITVSPAVALQANPYEYFGTLSVIITLGTGLGEIDAVTSINPTTNTITLAQPLAIVPDSTSRFNLSTPLEYNTAYKNTITNCAKGIWINGYDTVIADNTTINCSGVYTGVVNGKIVGTSAVEYEAYFDRMTGNTVVGVSRRNNCGGVGYYDGRWSGGNAPFLDVMVYGMEICNNTITGNNAYNSGPGNIESGPFSGIFAVSYGYSNPSNGVGVGDSTDALIQDNNLSDLKTGITLTQCDYAQVVSNNLYDGTVLNFLQNSGSTYGTSTETLNTGNVSGSFPTIENVAAQGTIIASVTNPTGGGNHNIGIINDGITPVPGTTNPALEWDSYNGDAGPAIQYYGYTFTGNQIFNDLVYDDGLINSNGGWFANGSLVVQVLQNGTWVTVPVTPAAPYPNGNTQAAMGHSFQTYNFELNDVEGNGIRIDGTAGGTAQYVSISQLEVWARAFPSTITGSGANNTYDLRIDPLNSQDAQLFVNIPTWGIPSYEFSKSLIAGLGIGGGSGNNSLTVDFTYGDPISSYGVSFAGGSGSANSLFLEGTSAAEAFSISASQITDTADSTTVAYSNLQTIQFDLFGSSNSLTETAAPGAAVTVNVNNGTLSLAGPSTFTLGGALNLAAGTSAVLPTATGSEDQLVVNSLSIGAGATLNLVDNEILINYGSGTDPITTIAADIKSGYNNGGWNGTGIISTTAQTLTNGLYYGIGYADFADAGNPAQLAAGQIKLMYTLLGDATLSGKVDTADFSILAENFGMGVTGWDKGDFNYDGAVNGTDFSDLAANFNQGVSLPAAVAVVVSATPAATTPVTAAPPKSKPAGGSKAAISGITDGKSTASAVRTYAAAVVTVPTAGSASGSQDIRNNDATFLADQ